MAFTQDGMFYISEKEAAPAADMLGTGVRGMLGVENKEEAIQRILKEADYSTPESRRVALEQIRAIDPATYYELSKANQQHELTEQKLTHGKDKPLIEQRWNLESKYAAAADWAAESFIGEETYADLAADIKKNPKQANLLINQYISKNHKDDKVAYRNEFKDAMTAQKEIYIAHWLATGVDSNFNTSIETKPTLNDEENTNEISTSTEHLESLNPDSSKLGLQWEKNKRTSQIDNLGATIKPGGLLPYNTGSVSRMPGLDATFGNVQDALTSGINAATSSIADIGNLFSGTVEGDKQRDIAAAASDWFISNAGHNHFANNPKELDKILKSANKGKAAIAYYKKIKQPKSGYSFWGN